MKTTQKWNVRDVITTVLLTVLLIVIQLIVNMSAWPMILSVWCCPWLYHVFVCACLFPYGKPGT